jgi:hypothetical protein
MENMDFSTTSPGQHCPQHYPQPPEPNLRADETLGRAMDIEETANLLGCSVWTVRQRYLPQGLPHLRASAGGKLVFFKRQVVGWILQRQRKQGG